MNPVLVHGRKRVVICVPGADENRWELPASSSSLPRWPCGGEQSLYELAVAAAATGRTVELRGSIVMDSLDRLARAAGACPLINLPPRSLEADDIVILPEGHTDPFVYARAALSPARCVLMMLAPPGLFGWPFLDGLSPFDPLTVDPAALARPEHFRAIADCGFDLWSNSSALAAASCQGGVECAWLGVGWLTLPARAVEKDTDVVALQDNRWFSLARKVLERLTVSQRVIPRVLHQDLLRELARGRILVWPSRVEGWSRIQCEARCLGTVPVALAGNRFAEGLDERHGAVLVNDLAELPAAIQALLQDPDRLRNLSARAVTSARVQVDWKAYVARVEAALSELEQKPPGRRDRTPIGRALLGWGAILGERKALVDRVLAGLDGNFALTVEALAATKAVVCRAAEVRRPTLTERLRTALKGPPRVTPNPLHVLLLPGRFDDPLYSIKQALDRLGAQVDESPAPGRVYDLVLGWHDSNWFRTPGQTARSIAVQVTLASAVRDVAARHYWNCSPALDISKRVLGETFERVFGRRLSLDPAVHQGIAVEKSDENATHDGRLVQCPMAAVLGKVYQRFVDGAGPPFLQWRVMLLERVVSVTIERQQDPENRFASGALAGRLVPTDQAFSPEEREGLSRLCAALHAEYCELDVLRDREGVFWVVDVNPTPTLSDVGVRDPVERDRILQAMSAALEQRLRS